MLTYNLEERGKNSLYDFLYQKIREDILQGRMSWREKLPSKRELAGHLKISVKTVENAYAQLLTEGYIYAEEKRGYFVSKIEKTRPAQPGIAFFSSRYREEEYLVDLTANHSAYQKFPFSTWAKVMRETLTDYDVSLFKTVPFNGVETLRVEIAEYLYRYRGMQVSPDHIVIGAGTEYLYGRLMQLLGSEAKYAVENPGYRKIARLYESFHAAWTHVDMDEQGLCVKALENTGANVVHVSPGHHFPMGIVMPAGRRQELLRWAAARPGRYIVEDDYDCEFRFNGRPIPALQTMDRNHRVIYLNTFSRTMVPSLRIGYMVLPEKLMEKYVSTMNFYSCTVSGFEQYAMAAFIQKGYFERHIRRMSNYYRQQQEKVLELFREPMLREKGTVLEADAGTHFLWKVRTQLNDVEIKWAAKEKGICLSCLSEYCFADPEKYRKTLIINYSDLSGEQLQYMEKTLGEIL